MIISARNCINQNCPKYSIFENGIWKGPSVIPPDGYYKYGEILLQTMKANANLIGQIDVSTQVEDTYGNMAERCIRCALWLKKQGIQPGEVIGLISSNHLNSVIPFLSSLMVGTVFNPWWQGLGIDLLLSLMKLTCPKVLFVDETNVERIKQVIDLSGINVKLVCFQNVDGLEWFDEILAAQKADEIANFECESICSPNQPAVIMFTSGTTGPSKGAVLSYGTLADAEVFIPAQYIWKTPGTFLSTLDWISGVAYFHTAIRASATIIMNAGPIGQDFFRNIEKYKIQWIGMIALRANEVVKKAVDNKYDLSSVKYVCFGGHSVPDNVFESMKKFFPNANIWHCYGGTELAGKIAQVENNRLSGSVGKVVRNMELKVSDENGATIVKPYKTGEFCVRTPNMMNEYYKNPEATAAAFDFDGWYRTGDIGYYNENGDLFITDRIKDLIKYIRYNISSIAVENAISDHPGVREVAVVGISNDLQIVPVAFVVKEPSIDVTAEEIINLVKNKKLYEIQVPYEVKFIKALPRTASGKISKVLIRQKVKLVED